MPVPTSPKLTIENCLLNAYPSHNVFIQVTVCMQLSGVRVYEVPEDYSLVLYWILEPDEPCALAPYQQNTVCQH